MTASIVTFYSFKGGVGRTQAIANVAVALARKGHKIVVVDMDLESPGLHTYFTSKDDQEWPDATLRSARGVLDFLDEASQIPEKEPSLAPYLIDCSHRNLHEDSGAIRLLLPGRLDDSYVARVAGFSWKNFYEAQCGYQVVEAMRRRLVESDADFVLIDSRTGTTDVAGICTFQLPDIVVAMTAPHRQGIEGVRRVAKAITKARASGATERARKLVLLLSRVEEDSELDLREYWVRRARQQMGEIDATVLFDQYKRIPYEARAAFGEPVVVGNPTSSYLADAYEKLSECLLELTGKVARARPEPVADLGDRLTAVTAAAASRIRRHVRSTLAELRTLIERELREIRDVLASRYQEHGQLSMPAGLRKAPDSLAECERFARDIEKQVDRAWSDWRKAWEQRFRVNLLETAEGDEAVVEAKLAELRPFLEVADIDGAQARIASLMEEVRRGSRNALLAQNQLERAYLEQSISDRRDRIAWLEEKLDQAVQVELAGHSGNPSRALGMIRNCLRLLMQENKAEPRYWAPYESLCMHTDNDADREQDFDTIGKELWLAGWRDYLSGAAPTAPSGALPAGRHMREQLRQRLDCTPEIRKHLGGVIAEHIVETWQRWHGQPGCAASFAALFREQREDPAVVWALGNLPAAAQAATRRGLTASYLLRTGLFDRGIAMQFLRALIDEGYAAEAFLARAAWAESKKDVDEASLSLVVAGLAVAAVAATDSEVLRDLLADSEHRKALGRDDAVGRKILIALAGGLLSHTHVDSAVWQQLTAEVLHSDGYLSGPCRAWLEWRQTRTDWDVAKARQVAILEGVCARKVAEFPVHRSWEPSHGYKQKCHEYWQRAVAHIRAGDPLENQLSEQAFERWLRDAERELRAHHPRNVTPTDRLRERMHESFKGIQQAMRELRDYLRENHIRATTWQEGQQLYDACREDLRGALQSSARTQGVAELIAMLNSQGGLDATA